MLVFVLSQSNHNDMVLFQFKFQFHFCVLGKYSRSNSPVGALLRDEGEEF